MLYVVKTDGLAAGKGVLVTESEEEAIADLVAKLERGAVQLEVMPEGWTKAWRPWRSCWLRLRRHRFGPDWQGHDRLLHTCEVCGATRVTVITGPAGVFRG